MLIKIQKITPEAKIPARASNRAVGYDVWALRILDKDTKNPIANFPYTIEAGESALIGIGIRFAVPWPIQCEVRPRSGLANRFDMELSNSPGTIDPDFRGEAGILLRNRGKKSFTIKSGMRVAQLIFSKVEIPVFEEADELPESVRGVGGFGSTGLLGIQEGDEIYRREIEKMDQFYMRMAIAASERSNCIRGAKRNSDGNLKKDGHGNLIGLTRRFGCVIVKDDNIISFGFNAQYLGSKLCEKVGCLRDTLKIPSGTQLEKCRATHAEEMAFSKLAVSGIAVSTKGATLYVNSSPCELCAKSIAEKQIETVVILRGVYPEDGLNILKEAGVNIRFLTL
jgi:deoxyuridine 5'-triphosphate nucleotidohydrolase